MIPAKVAAACMPPGDGDGGDGGSVHQWAELRTTAFALNWRAFAEDFHAR